MPRRSSYLFSIEDELQFNSLPLPSTDDNFLKPPSPTNGSSRKESVVSASDTIYSYVEKPKGSLTNISFTEHIRDPALRPFVLYSTFIGLYEGYSINPKLQSINIAYCYLVTVILFIGSIRRFQQIGLREPGQPDLSWGQAIFDPTIVLTIVNALFLMSGALSSFVLTVMGRKKREFTATFASSLKKYRDSRNVKTEARNIKIVVAACIFLGLLSSVGHKIKALHLPWIPPLITEDWYFWPLEFYLAFMAESAITVLVITFASSCSLLSHSIQSLMTSMVPDMNHEDCPLPEESLRRIRDVQLHHQDILSAKTMLEENFSFVLFFTYGFSIPAICFLGYLMLKNISEENWAMHLSLAMWIFNILISLLMMSVPAFMIHEDGEKLLSASFKMYHEALCEERDLLVVSQMILLVFQIHSAKLTLSASNYFSMNRKILISEKPRGFMWLRVDLVDFVKEKRRGRLPVNRGRFCCKRMPRRTSYIQSIENSTCDLPVPYGNYLIPPLPSLGSRSGSLVSGTKSVISKNGTVTNRTARTASVVSQSTKYSDYEEQEKVRSPSPHFSEQFRNDVGWPMYLYTTLLGLNEGYFSNHRGIERIYSVLVIIALFLGSIRRGLQIGTREEELPPLSWGQAIFDPTIVLTICNAAFLMSGALAALFMMFMRRKRNAIASVHRETLQKFLEERDDADVARKTRISVVLCLGFSIVATFSKLLYKIKALHLPWLPPLITEDWYYWPVEFYLTFIAESSICIMTMFFSQSCNIIRFSIKCLLNEMLPGDHEDCPLPEESLRRIRDVQIHHQEILSIKSMLEENFSFVLFYSYGCVIPAICFMGYLILKNITTDNWALHLSLAMWILTTLSALLMMSIPAFMIHEDGEKLLAASFKMYHEGLCEERDLLVVSQMTLLVFQIHSAKLTLSASNYFSMNRKILISLFSAIFTYFLILVQFGQTTAKDLSGNYTLS